jgi:hypothetical protein
MPAVTAPSTVNYRRTTSMKANGRNLEPGTEFSVRGQRGRFRFLALVEHLPTGHTWIDAYGGDRDPRGRRQFRAFRPEDIRTVHRTKERRR